MTQLNNRCSMCGEAEKCKCHWSFDEQMWQMSAQAIAEAAPSPYWEYVRSGCRPMNAGPAELFEFEEGDKDELTT